MSSMMSNPTARTTTTIKITTEQPPVIECWKETTQCNEQTPDSTHNAKTNPLPKCKCNNASERRNASKPSSWLGIGIKMQRPNHPSKEAKIHPAKVTRPPPKRKCNATHQSKRKEMRLAKMATPHPTPRETTAKEIHQRELPNGNEINIPRIVHIPTPLPGTKRLQESPLHNLTVNICPFQKWGMRK